METYHPTTAIPILGGCFVFFIALIVVVLTTLVFCKVFSKAGYHWALGLIALIPIGQIVLLLILAFSEWPIERQLRACQHGGTGPISPSGQPRENFRGV